MSKLTQYVNDTYVGFKSSMTTKVKGTMQNFIANAGLSAYLEPLNKIKTVLSDRQSAYDALLAPFMADDVWMDKYTDLLARMRGYYSDMMSFKRDVVNKYNDFFTYAEVTKNFALSVVDGMIAAARRLKQIQLQLSELPDIDEELVLSLTTSSGNVLAIRFEPTGVEKWPYRLYARVGVDANGNPGSSDYLLNGYDPAADKYYFAPCIPSITWNPGDEANCVAFVPLVELVSSLTQSSTLNGEISSACSCIMGGRYKEYISYAQNKISDLKGKASTVKDSLSCFMNGVISAYSRAGFRGMVQYLLSLFRSLNSIKLNDNYILEFTDNASFRPREFIAGIVTTVVSAIGSIVAAIITAIKPAIGAAITLLGSIGYGIVKSISSTHDDTRASLTITDDTGSTMVLPCTPLALFQTATDKIPTWYKSMFDNGDSVLYLPVVGGLLLIGPGSFTSEALEDKAGNFSSADLLTINIEYHPYATGYIYDMNIARSSLWSFVDSIRDGSQTVSATAFFNMGRFFSNPVDLASLWVDCLDSSNVSSPSAHFISNDASTGVLSVEDDTEIRRSISMSLVMFILYCMRKDDYVVGLWRDGNPNLNFRMCSRRIISGTSGHGTPMTITRTIGEKIFSILAAGFPTGNSEEVISTFWDDVPSWAELVQFAQDVADDSSTLFIGFFGDYPTENSTDYISDFGCEDLHAAIYSVVANNLVTGTFASDDPVAISSVQSEYAVIMPKYNADTYWLWVGLAAATTAAVAAVAIVGTVKFKAFQKRKLASNIAKFNDAQATYQAAAVGMKYDEEQGKDVSFDMKSPEGQEYIKQCYRSYKSQAFKNNLWSHIVGGSRYDIKSFWGEAEEAEETENPEEEADAAGVVEAILPYNDASSELVTLYPNEISLNTIFTLISGIKIE